MEAVVCVTTVKEKETIVKNRIARIKLECTFADFFQDLQIYAAIMVKVTFEIKSNI